MTAFGLPLGSPFTNPTGRLPSKDAGLIKILDHALNVIYKTPFRDETWHNFAVIVDWDKKTLQVFSSPNEHALKPVSPKKANPTVPDGEAGSGDFHIGVLKVSWLRICNEPSRAERSLA